MFDKLFAAEIVERCSKDGFLGLVGELTGGILSEKWSLLEPGDETIEVAGLFFVKGRIWGRIHGPSLERNLCQG
jgi:hypothetical protein